MILAFTGHRPESLRAPDHEVRARLDRVLHRLRPMEVVIGLARGVDTLAGEAALALDIPLVCAVPFPGFNTHWGAEDQGRFRRLIHGARAVYDISPSGRPYGAKYLARDAWVVARCDALVAVWDGRPSGGAAKTVAMARKARKPVVIIDPTMFGG